MIHELSVSYKYDLMQERKKIIRMSGGHDKSSIINCSLWLLTIKGSYSKQRSRNGYETRHISTTTPRPPHDMLVSVLAVQKAGAGVRTILSQTDCGGGHMDSLHCRLQHTSMKHNKTIFLYYMNNRIDFF